MRKFQLVIGWIAIVCSILMVIAMAVGLVYSYLLENGEGPNLGVIVRGAIMIPLGFWWGIRQVRKYRAKEVTCE